MDLVELPAAAAVRHGLCIKSEIGDCSFDRSIFVSTNPTKYMKLPASSGSRDGGFSPYGSRAVVDPKTGPRQFEKFSFRWPARREPGRRPKAYTPNPLSSRARPTQARYGRLFSRDRPTIGPTRAKRTDSWR